MHCTWNCPEFLESLASHRDLSDEARMGLQAEANWLKELENVENHEGSTKDTDIESDTEPCSATSSRATAVTNPPSPSFELSNERHPRKRCASSSPEIDSDEKPPRKQSCIPMRGGSHNMRREVFDHKHKVNSDGTPKEGPNDLPGSPRRKEYGNPVGKKKDPSGAANYLFDEAERVEIFFRDVFKHDVTFISTLKMTYNFGHNQNNAKWIPGEDGQAVFGSGDGTTVQNTALDPDMYVSNITFSPHICSYIITDCLCIHLVDFVVYRMNSAMVFWRA